MTTTTDIGNRALQLLGTRTTMASLAEQSNEAEQISLVFDAIQRWCFGLANWNFARNTAVLSNNKTVSNPPPSTWSTTSPSPPWAIEYILPSDFIQAIYITNPAINSAGNAYLGEPQRFQMAVDVVSAVQKEVLLANTSNAVLIYTCLVADPTQWPWYFERLVVLALAQTICMALTGNMKLLEMLEQKLEQQISIATQANTIEGLMFPDTTPEWVQALGIDYPYRRVDGRVQVAPPQMQRQRGNQQ